MEDAGGAGFMSILQVCDNSNRSNGCVTSLVYNSIVFAKVALLDTPLKNYGKDMEMHWNLTGKRVWKP